MMNASAIHLLAKEPDFYVESAKDKQTENHFGLYHNGHHDCPSPALSSSSYDTAKGQGHTPSYDRAQHDENETMVAERLRKAEIQLKANRVKTKRLKDEMALEKSRMLAENEKLAIEIQDLLEELRESDNRQAQMLAENAYLKSQNSRLEQERDAIAEHFHAFSHEKMLLEPKFVEDRIAAVRAEERKKAAVIFTEQKQTAEALAVAQARADILEFEIKCMKEELAKKNHAVAKAMELSASSSHQFEDSADLSQRSKSITDNDSKRSSNRSLTKTDKNDSSKLVPTTSWMKATVLDLFSRQTAAADDRENSAAMPARRRPTKSFSDPRLDISMHGKSFNDETASYHKEVINLMFSDTSLKQKR